MNKLSERDLAYIDKKVSLVRGRGGKNNSKGGLTKMEERDKECLLETLDAFEVSLLSGIDPKAKGLTNSERTPLEMATIIMQYFRFCITNGMAITISGIGIYLGMDKDEFQKKCANKNPKDPNMSFLQKCVYFVEMYMEYTAQRKQNPAFQIFWLKNRGWVDKLEISASSTQGALSDEEREAAQKRISQFSEIK
jgi:hypothetical protein